MKFDVLMSWTQIREMREANEVIERKHWLEGRSCHTFRVRLAVCVCGRSRPYAHEFLELGDEQSVFAVSLSFHLL